jgi:hypothetical protein
MHIHYQYACEAAGASGIRHSHALCFKERKNSSNARALRAAKPKTHVWNCFGCLTSESVVRRRATPSAVIIRLDRMSQYFEPFAIQSKGRSILDTPRHQARRRRDPVAGYDGPGGAARRDTLSRYARAPVPDLAGDIHPVMTTSTTMTSRLRSVKACGAPAGIELLCKRSEARYIFSDAACCTHISTRIFDVLWRCEMWRYETATGCAFLAKTDRLASLRAERDRGAGAIDPEAEAAAEPAALATDRELSAAGELR